MPSSQTASIKNLWACIKGAEAYGFDAARICALLQVDPALLADPDARVPAALCVRAWKDVPEACGADDFGLVAAERMTAVSYDIIDYVVHNTRTAGDILRVLLRYQRLIHDSHVIQVETTDDTTRVLHRFDSPDPTPPAFSEFLLAIWYGRLRRAIGTDFDLVEVAFQHPRPTRLDALQRTFRAPLSFSAPLNMLALPAAVLERPAARGDPMLGQILENHANHLQTQLPPLDEFRHRLRQLIMEELANGAPSLETCARRMAMSTRSLQRRLQGEGTSFQEFLDEVRRSMALSYVRDARHSLTDIVFQLGFSDNSSFHRSFRRWTGTTPARYRKESSSPRNTRIA